MYSQEDLNQILRDAKARHQGDARFSPPPRFPETRRLRYGVAAAS